MKNLFNLIKAENHRKREATIFYIEHGYFRSWADKTESERGLKDNLTPYRWKLYQDGKITREAANAYAIKRAFKQIEKDEQKKLEKLERVWNAENLGEIHINITWKKSSYWGYNPTATVKAYDENGHFIGEYTGTAGGCGYDKGSAALADAMNQCNSILKVMYIKAENALEHGEKPITQGLCDGCYSWREILGYGSGYDVLPYFEGGVGVNCFNSILTGCGYTWRTVFSDKKSDVYLIEK